jgi:hypothetical protein
MQDQIAEFLWWRRRRRRRIGIGRWTWLHIVSDVAWVCLRAAVHKTPMSNRDLFGRIAVCGLEEGVSVALGFCDVDRTHDMV